MVITCFGIISLVFTESQNHSFKADKTKWGLENWNLIDHHSFVTPNICFNRFLYICTACNYFLRQFLLSLAANFQSELAQCSLPFCQLSSFAQISTEKIYTKFPILSKWKIQIKDHPRFTFKYLTSSSIVAELFQVKFKNN